MESDTREGEQDEEVESIYHSSFVVRLNDRLAARNGGRKGRAE